MTRAAIIALICAAIAATAVTVATNDCITDTECQCEEDCLE